MTGEQLPALSKEDAPQAYIAWDASGNLAPIGSTYLPPSALSADASVSRSSSVRWQVAV